MTSSNRLSYIPGLDGIRAMAVMAVLFYHANYPWALGGFLGVETFFVLSGFLITSLLLAEWQSTGRIDLKNFWLRRARRLLPAVWLLVLVLPGLAILFAHDAIPRLQEDIPAALLYITNWVYIVREVSYFEAFGRPPLLQQLWSLAVEEQFYLLWPLLLLFLLRTLARKPKYNRFGLLAAIAAMIAASSIWMAGLFSPDAEPLRIYYGTDTRASGFLVGAMLAVIWSPQRAAQSRASDRSLLELLGWSGLLALIFLYNRLNEFQPFLYRGGFLVTGLVSALIIVAASSPATFLSKFLENPVLRWIGSRSYSIYLWHWPVFMLTRPGIDLQLPELLIRFGQVTVTFVLAELSYRWVETPIRREGFVASFDSFRRAFTGWSVPQKFGVGAVLLSVSLLLIWQGTIHPVTATTLLEEPASTRAAPVNATPTRPAAAATRPASGPPARTPAAATATAALDLPRATLIGDSIMQGALPMLEEMLGPDVYIDAARKRKMEDVPALVQTLSRQRHLSHTVVIHLGSNRPFEAAAFDEVMESLLAHDVKRVIFLNVHRPIGWEYTVNKRFAEGLRRWPQAELIDWEAMSHGEPAWFIRDQTHLSYEGSTAYVNAIKEKLSTTRSRTTAPHI